MSETADETDGAGPSHRSIEVLVAGLMAVLAAIGIFGSLQAGIGWAAEGPRAGFFPFYVSVIVLVSSAINLVHVLRQTKARRFATWNQLRQVMSVVIPTAAYVILVPYLGIYVSSGLLIGIFMKWLGGYRWLVVIAVAVGVPVLIYLMFEHWFLVPLPKGPVEDWLGL